jgi:diguanylate cyclase (GGDEF)-like protein
VRADGEQHENEFLLAALRERQALLERLSELQRAIVNRTALAEVLELVAEGLEETLGDVLVAIRLVDPGERGPATLVTSHGATQRLAERWRTARVVELLSRPALEGGRVVVTHEPEPAAAEAEFAAEGVRAAVAAPLYERGRIAGALAVGTTSEDRRFEPEDEEIVLAFAELASLALNDARAAAEATHEAFHDSLTGLPNRSLFIDRLNHALARIEREGAPLAVLFCDLDGFKTVNDSLGHAAGDRLLQAVGRRLEESLRPSDTVARFGGDEFAVLLEELARPEDAARAAARVIAQLEAPFEIEGREIFVGISVGIAAASRGDDADSILRNADLAMYRAKARGKGRYEVYEDSMHAEIVRRMDMELDLKRAVEREQIVVHYQPIFDLPSGEVAGLEALVRWQHPTRGLLRPDQFIPIAEESGQIAVIGRHVLREACRQLALWRARYPAYEWLYVSVNVSGVQLREAGIVDEVDAALRAAELDPAHLMLEMTETVLMGQSEAARARLEALRALGVRLAIDDFGTGYSSLEYLDRLPIDALKIAKPFVDRLGGGPGSDAIPRAIADLAEIFGLVVIAEGIERTDQPEHLVEIGCRFGQGNNLSGPLDPAGADAALMRSGLLGSETGEREPRHAE